MKTNEIELIKELESLNLIPSLILQLKKDAQLSGLDFQCAPNSSAKEFETIAILTTSKTTIIGESVIKGSVKSYEVIKLEGTASRVVS